VKVHQSKRESSQCGEKFQQIRRSLAGTVIAEIVPEVRVLLFKARLIEQVRVAFEGGWFRFNELPQTGDCHEKCSVLFNGALRFDNRLCVMGNQGIEHRSQAKCSN
jgi:hypothetical protein